jgi:hypothetical protein
MFLASAIVFGHLFYLVDSKTGKVIMAEILCCPKEEIEITLSSTAIRPAIGGILFIPGAFPGTH